MIKTVKVPKQFSPLFEKAQDNVAGYFKDLAMDPSKGSIVISGERYIPVRAASASVDFFDIFSRMYGDEDEEAGVRAARQSLFDLGHSIGIQDAKNFHAKLGLIDPVEKLSAGPVHFAYSGWAFVDISPASRPVPDDDYFLLYDHPYSFEADSWIKAGRKSSVTVCIMNAGYSSGWCQESFGVGLASVEITCRAKGDDACRFIMAPPARLEGHVRDYLARNPELSGRAANYDIPAFLKGKEIEKWRRMAMLAAEDRFRGLVETSTDWMWELDENGVYTYSSPQVTNMLGYKPEEIVGKSFCAVMCPDGPQRDCKPLHEALARQKPFTDLEYTCAHRSGYKTTLESSCRPGTNPADGRTVCRGTTHDISSRKYAEQCIAESKEQLRQAQKMEAVGRLAGGIAHDFNNLLMSMGGYAEFVLDTLPESDKRRADLKRIMSAADQAASLTHQLLAFSRRQVLEPRTLDLDAAIKGNKNMLRSLIKESIELEFSFAPGLKNVKADPCQLEQVIMNLLINSNAAIPGHGKICLAACNISLSAPLRNIHDTVPAGAYVRLMVSDTGAGMNSEMLGHLFEPFFTTKALHKGAGLGLSTVYGIIKQSKGYIFADSAVGRGTVISIYFPQAAEQPAGQPEIAAAEADRPAYGTILVVEDQPQVREVVTRSLTENGYTVLTAADGEEALSMLLAPGRKEIHLVLTDLIMPKMGGVGLARKLKEICPGIKFIYMSGYTDDDELRRYGLKEGEAFLQKPVSGADLVRKVRQVLKTETARSGRAR